VSERRLRTAIVGCGFIAGPYVQSLLTYPEIEVAGVASRRFARASSFAERFGCGAYSSLDNLLGDERVDLVVNLTPQHAHAEIITRCLQAGKHVYSEKPLALTFPEARRLVSLAERRGLRLACAPATFLGEAQQTVMRLVRDGALGTVRVAYAEMNWGRIEAWHPDPAPFFEVGPFFDLGPYPLTLLTGMFGPVRRAAAFGKTVYPERVCLDGSRLETSSPDHVTSILELESGTTARVTASFYAGPRSKQRGLELHGDSGSLYLASFLDYDAPVQVSAPGGSYAPTPLLGQPFRGVEWGRGVRDLARAILAARPHRAGARHACHVVEVMSAVRKSIATGRPVTMRSSFDAPAPMEWAASVRTA